MKKRILSLALALVLCLGLTVPAFAAEDTEKTYTGECELGKVSVIMNGWLRTEYVPTRYDPIAYGSVSEADTVLAIHVVEDGSTVKIEPLDFELNAQFFVATSPNQRWVANFLSAPPTKEVRLWHKTPKRGNISLLSTTRKTKA